MDRDRGRIGDHGGLRTLSRSVPEAYASESGSAGGTLPGAGSAAPQNARSLVMVQRGHGRPRGDVPPDC
jgi:hypothetical protein